MDGLLDKLIEEFRTEKEEKEKEKRKIEDAKKATLALEKERRTKISSVQKTKWGTPELAYKSWEDRVRKLVERADGLISKLKAEHEELMEDYGSKKFYVTHKFVEKRDNIHPLLRDFFPDKIRREVDVFTIADIIYDYYRWIIVRKNGTKADIFLDCSDLVNRELNDEAVNLRKRADTLLKRAQKIKTSIKEYIVAPFFYYGHELLKASGNRYSFECEYTRSPNSIEGCAEDIVASLTFTSRHIRVPNPCLICSDADVESTLYMYLFGPSKGYDGEGNFVGSFGYIYESENGTFRKHKIPPS